MGSPRTLDALRSAVARVLTARGEAPDALRVTADNREWLTSITIDAPAGQWWGSGRGEPDAVWGAWSVFYDHVWRDASGARLARRVAERAGADETALATLRAAEDRAQAALSAARAVEIEQGAAALTAARAVEAGE